MKFASVVGGAAEGIEFKNSTEHKRVKNAIKRHDRTYIALRFIKKIIYIPFNDKQKDKINKIIMTILNR